jgi:hypothetical protein
MINGKDMEGNGRGLILRYYSDILLEGLSKTTKTLSQDSRISDRDLNLGPREYGAGVLTTRPRRSVADYCEHGTEPKCSIKGGEFLD